MDVISSKERKARKQHQCNWCGSTIEKGEMYKCSTNTFCGEIYEWKECYRCKELVQAMFNSNYLVDYHATQEEFMDYISETYDKPISELLQIKQ